MTTFTATTVTEARLGGAPGRGGGMKHQDPLIGTVWRRRNGRVIRITEAHPAATPLDVHRVSWEVADGSRGPGYGTMDLDTLTEHLAEVG